MYYKEDKTKVKTNKENSNSLQATQSTNHDQKVGRKVKSTLLFQTERIMGNKKG